MVTGDAGADLPGCRSFASMRRIGRPVSISVGRGMRCCACLSDWRTLSGSFAIGAGCHWLLPEIFRQQANGREPQGQACCANRSGLQVATLCLVDRSCPVRGPNEKRPTGLAGGALHIGLSVGSPDPVRRSPGRKFYVSRCRSCC